MEDIDNAARDAAMRIMEPFWESIEEVFAEQRRKHVPEAAIQAKVKQLCGMVERQSRSNVPPYVIEEMLAMVREIAMRGHKTPSRGSH
jgi:hypothetical protein